MTEDEKDLCSRLFTEVMPKLKKLCEVKMCGCISDSDDVIAKTYLALCIYVDEIGVPALPEAWLYSVLNNQINLNFKEIYKSRSTEQYNDEENSPECDSAENEAILKMQCREILKKIGEQIEPADLELYFEITKKEASIEQLAKQNGVSEAAIKQKKYRTAKKIKKIVKDAGIDLH